MPIRFVEFMLGGPRDGESVPYSSLMPAVLRCASGTYELIYCHQCANYHYLWAPSSESRSEIHR